MNRLLLLVAVVFVGGFPGGEVSGASPPPGAPPGGANLQLKGETGEVLPLRPSGRLVWADGRVAAPLEVHRRKGDEGVLDPRGTVRYNVMPNGRMARGVVSSPQDDDSPITQAASAGLPAAASYNPVEVEMEETELEEEE